MPMQKRPTGWYCRVVVPSYIGTGEVVRSLRTASRSEAARRWHHVESVIRHAMVSRPMLTREQFKTLVDTHLKAAEEALWRAYGAAPPVNRPAAPSRPPRSGPPSRAQEGVN
ncbi:MAG: hypothetical protein H6Q33_5235 [Deltaproteobacteria bacterium]|nr:hypothetical protein [Deltaproteobacteria bacterium]